MGGYQTPLVFRLFDAQQAAQDLFVKSRYAVAAHGYQRLAAAIHLKEALAGLLVCGDVIFGAGNAVFYTTCSGPGTKTAGNHFMQHAQRSLW